MFLYLLPDLLFYLCPFVLSLLSALKFEELHLVTIVGYHLTFQKRFAVNYVYIESFNKNMVVN